MARQFHYARQLQWSDKSKEATYDAGVSLASNFRKLDEFDDGVFIESAEVISNYDKVTGTEFGTEIRKILKDVKGSISFQYAKPQDVARVLAYGLGSISSIQDGVETAYAHKITVGSSLPSFQLEADCGGVQRKFTGCKIDKVTISADAKYLSVAADIIGSGRAQAGFTSGVTALTEAPLLISNAKYAIETDSMDNYGTNINTTYDFSTAANVAKALWRNATTTYPNVGSGATEYRGKILNWTLEVANNLRADQGYLALNTNDNQARGALEKGRRKITFSFTSYFDDSTELDHFLNQDYLAFECNIDLGDSLSTNYNRGLVLILPLVKISEPVDIGDDDGVITADFSCEVLTPSITLDGSASNSPIVAVVFNAESAYAA